MRLHLYHHYYFLPSIYVMLKHIPLIFLGKRALLKTFENKESYGEKILQRPRPSPLHLRVDYRRLHDPLLMPSKLLLSTSYGYRSKVLHVGTKVYALEANASHFPILMVNKYMPL